MTTLVEQVTEASRLMRSPDLAERKAGQHRLRELSAEHGHAAIDRAKAAARLLPAEHMAYWST